MVDVKKWAKTPESQARMAHRTVSGNDKKSSDVRKRTRVANPYGPATRRLIGRIGGKILSVTAQHISSRDALL